MSSALHHNNHNEDDTQASQSSLQHQQQPMSFFMQTPGRQHNGDGDHGKNDNNAASLNPLPPAQLSVAAPRTPSPRKLVKHTTPSPRPCPFRLAAGIESSGTQQQHGHYQHQKTTTTHSKIPPTRIRTVYLIRHGESLGQTFSREARERGDATLLDCGLTETGREQARSIFRSNKAALASIRLVLSSPLTRALETALLAFPDNSTTNIPIVVHYELRELGRIIPENTPRPINVVLNDLLMPKNNDADDDDDESTRICEQRRVIDTETFRPDRWPRDHDTPPKVVRRGRIRQVFQWLATSSASSVAAAAVKLEEQQKPDCNDHGHHDRVDAGGENDNHDNDDDDDDFAVAVVCHYHVIRAALSDPHSCRKVDVRPENAKPIKCRLHEDGRLTVVQQTHEDDDVDEDPITRSTVVAVNNNSPSQNDHGDNGRRPSQSGLGQKNLDKDFSKQQQA